MDYARYDVSPRTAHGIDVFDDGIMSLLHLQEIAPDEAEKIIGPAHKMGICVIVDLMYNLPQQTKRIWGNDLLRAFS